MKANLKKHLSYYIVAIAIFAMGLVLIVLNNHDNRLQALLIAMTATCYFMWSLLHHYVHHELHPRVVIEYILMVVLGIVLSFYLFSV
jgi:hypothetical protein